MYIYIRNSIGEKRGVTVERVTTVEGIRGFYYVWGRGAPQFWASLPGQGNGAADYAYSNGGTLYRALVDRIKKEMDNDCS